MVVSPKSGPWWILWICVCPWLVRAPKALKLHTNWLVIWFVQVHVNNWCLSLFLNPHPGAPACPSTPKVFRAGEHAPTLYSFIVFTSNSHLSQSKSLGARHNIPNVILNWNTCEFRLKISIYYLFLCSL